MTLLHLEDDLADQSLDAASIMIARVNASLSFLRRHIFAIYRPIALYDQPSGMMSAVSFEKHLFIGAEGISVWCVSALRGCCYRPGR